MIMPAGSRRPLGDPVNDVGEEPAVKPRAHQHEFLLDDLLLADVARRRREAEKSDAAGRAGDAAGLLQQRRNAGAVDDEARAEPLVLRRDGFGNRCRGPNGRSGRPRIPRLVPAALRPVGYDAARAVQLGHLQYRDADRSGAVDQHRVVRRDPRAGEDIRAR